jgi:predicted nucleic acid-binding protein
MERKNYLIDTNVAIYYFGLAMSNESEKFMDQILGKKYYISVINRIELLGFKRLNGNESDALSSFISNSIIIDLE